MKEMRSTSAGSRRRGRPRSLTEQRIVAAALKLSADGWLEDLSMRALAAELSVPVMTLYNYVPSKDALQELVLNHVLRPVRVPPPDVQWRDTPGSRLAVTAVGAARRCG